MYLKKHLLIIIIKYQNIINQKQQCIKILYLHNNKKIKLKKHHKLDILILHLNMLLIKLMILIKKKMQVNY